MLQKQPMNDDHAKDPQSAQASLVLYCLIRREPAQGQPDRFLLIEKRGFPAFPPTKLRPGEDLYHAMKRPMERDLKLPPGSHYPEKELEAIPSHGESPRYPGLTKHWFLYPVTVSLTAEGWAQLSNSSVPLHWWTLDEVLANSTEPNIIAIATYLKANQSRLGETPSVPSMDALACRWMAEHSGGVRIVRDRDIRRILAAGSRAFNLRVADPYLPHQKQGLGFTWSFFTPKDKQECHFASWLEPEGLGTVIKAAAEGELAGVGRLGVAGKTTCKDCSMKGLCAMHPIMGELISQYGLQYEQRDYARIAELGNQAEASQWP
jgi:hypothetical protein